MLGMQGTDEERLNMFKNMTFKEFYTAHMSGGDWKTMETMAGKALQTEEMKMLVNTKMSLVRDGRQTISQLQRAMLRISQKNLA